MGIRVKGMVDPKVVIYDLGGISIYKDQVVELTAVQFNGSPNTQAMVAGGVLSVVIDAVTPPHVDPSISDVDQSFNLRNGVVEQANMSDSLMLVLQSAENVVFNPATTIFSSADVQALGVELSTLLADTGALDLKYNLSASVAPGADDDGTDGYSKGSRWYHDDGMGTQDEYVCLSNVTGAAVWKKTT